MENKFNFGLLNFRQAVQNNYCLKNCFLVILAKKILFLVVNKLYKVNQIKLFGIYN